MDNKIAKLHEDRYFLQRTMQIMQMRLMQIEEEIDKHYNKNPPENLPKEITDFQQAPTVEEEEKMRAKS